MERNASYASVLVTTARRHVAEWAEKARTAITMRDRWIVKMRAEGASLRDIASVAGTTAPTVERILRKANKDGSGLASDEETE